MAGKKCGSSHMLGTGVATLSYQLGHRVKFIDTEGVRGFLPPKGVEWMRSGGGAWHLAELDDDPVAPKAEDYTGFQLWIALPPKVEDGPSFSQFVAPEDVPTVSAESITVRVLSGQFKGAISPIRDVPADSIDTLDVTVSPGASFAHTFRTGHSTSWAVVYAGDARVNGQLVPCNELLIFEGSGDSISIENVGQCDAGVLVGSAAPHPFPLITKNASVHTNEASMKDGWKRIKQIGNELHAKGFI
ncbi:RmlC-like cupin domain-containing protein [Chytriomyces sp. MP71]|nr:RmlC-like cupin domain-containing protein [Chytriomyces sp. MP71]